MKRRFYLSDDIDALTALEKDLEGKGVERPQIRTISREEAALEKRDVPQVNSLLRKDVVHSTVVGAAVGLVVGAIPIVVALIIGLPQNVLWLPVIFLSIILLGFCAWEGGMIGIHRPNHHYRKFLKALNEDQHLLVVDVTPGQEALVNERVYSDPKIKDAGAGAPVPGWVVKLQRKFTA